MQIVIDMPDSTTKEMLENYESGSMFDEVLRGALKQAVILPKGHKRLIEDNFEVGPVFDEYGRPDGYRYITKYELDNAPTIIKADEVEK